MSGPEPVRRLGHRRDVFKISLRTVLKLITDLSPGTGLKLILGTYLG